MEFIKKTMKFIKKNKEKIKEKCAICLEPLGGEFITTVCHHKFHKECLGEWCNVNETTECPLCRRNINDSCHKIGILKGHSEWVNSVAISPDGKSVVSGSSDGTICIWDVKTTDGIPTLEQRQVLLGDHGWVNSVAFSPDGRFVVSGYNDNTIQLWDVESGTVTKTLEGHTKGVQSVAFSPSTDKSEGPTKGVQSVAFSPDGEYVVSGSTDETVCIWNLNTETGQILGEHNDEVVTVTFSPDGRYVASAETSDFLARIWDLETKQVKLIGKEDHWIYSMAFSPDGKYVVTASSDTTICFWDVNTGQNTQTLENGHTNDVLTVAFSPIGKYLVSGGCVGDNKVLIWDVNTKEGIEIGTHDHCVTSVAFSPDEKYVVSGSMDTTVKIWNVESLNQDGGNKAKRKKKRKDKKTTKRKDKKTTKRKDKKTTNQT